MGLFNKKELEKIEELTKIINTYEKNLSILHDKIKLLEKNDIENKQEHRKMTIYKDKLIEKKNIEIDSLIKRVESGDIHEVILALPTTMEGDTTNFYIYRRLQNTTLHDTTPLKISQIARGVAIGNEIEYTDEITLGRSIVNRIEFKL